MDNNQQNEHGENLVDLNEFLEYYTYVSALYDNDSDFDKAISNTWNLDSNQNPSSIPYAGIPKTITQVNTKERWLNDHHRAIIGGKEYDPINPHESDFQVPYKPPPRVTDPMLMKPAGRLTLQDYQVQRHEDQYAQELYPQHRPAEDPYQKPSPYKSYENKPHAYDYPQKAQKNAASHLYTYESPQKPKPTDFPKEENDDIISHHSGYSQASHHSQHSQHSQHSVHSQHSGYSHHSERSHPSQHSHHSQHSSQNPITQQYSQGYGGQRGYAEEPNFYQKPRQPANYQIHKNSRYY